MTKMELNEIIDACFLHLKVMKQFYHNFCDEELDEVDKENINQINDLLEDIQRGIQEGGLTELEGRYLYDDTESLWFEVSQQF